MLGVLDVIKEILVKIQVMVIFGLMMELQDYSWLADSESTFILNWRWSGKEVNFFSVMDVGFI